MSVSSRPHEHPRWRAFLGYVAASSLLLSVAAAALSAFLPPEARQAIWVAAGIALLLQLPAFAVLLAVREKGAAFLVAWGGGTVLRVGAVLAVGLWLARSPAFPPAPLLLSLAGFLLALLLLEPMFFRVGMRNS